MIGRVALVVAVLIGLAVHDGVGVAAPRWHAPWLADVSMSGGPSLSAALDSARERLARSDPSLGQVLAATGRHPTAASLFATAEVRFAAGDDTTPLPAARGHSVYLEVLRASRLLRNHGSVPMASWAQISEAASGPNLLAYGGAHAFRVATIAAVLNPTAGRGLARRLFAHGTRDEDPELAARALVLLGALERRAGNLARGREITRRAAYLAGSQSDGAIAYAALSQLVEFTPDADPDGPPICAIVPPRRVRARADCFSREAGRHWTSARLEEAIDSLEIARTLGAGLGAGWDLDLGRRSAPILVGLGRWDEFDAVVAPALETASAVGDADIEAELLITIAVAARARGYRAIASRALSTARGLRTTRPASVAVHVAIARAAVANGARDEASAALARALDLAGGEIALPFDARLLANSLKAPYRELGALPRFPVPAGQAALQAALDGTVRGAQLDATSQPRIAAYIAAARGLDLWSASAHPIDRGSAAGAAAAVWTQLARELLRANRPAEALLAVDSQRAGIGSRIELETLVADLPGATVVVVLAELDDEVWWWGLGEAGVSAGRVPASAMEVRRQSTAFANALRSDAPSSRYLALGRELGELVLAPVLEWGAEAQSLVVIPAAGLGEVPLDLVPLPGSGGGLLGDRYLTTRATSLGALHRAARSSPKGALRLGFVPRAGRDAREEARLLAASGARVLLGPRATREAFLALASGISLVHFGGHAIPADSPGGAALSFARNRALNIRDVTRLDLSGATVVLLACTTGASVSSPAGELPHGRSLAEAFVGAGGKGVAASLWPIDDGAARAVADALYGGGDIPTAAALVRAKRRLRAAYPAAPSRWAGFVWYGLPA
jgi:CHAT domain-containing protein